MMVTWHTGTRVANRQAVKQADTPTHKPTHPLTLPYTHPHSALPVSSTAHLIYVCNHPGPPHVYENKLPWKPVLHKLLKKSAQGANWEQLGAKVSIEFFRRFIS